MKSAQPTVLISGGFDPIHIGHVMLIRGAKKYGRVLVALNSDDWLMRKKGFVFLPFLERRAILREMDCDVTSVDDADDTVVAALRGHKPKYFANGGDRKATNTPEVLFCKLHGIELLWNVGGDKLNSSSQVARHKCVERKWGHYEVLYECSRFKVKRLLVLPGRSLSLQRHTKRQEVWIYADGSQTVIPVGEWHQLQNPGPETLEVIEVQTGEYFGEDDIERKVDI